MDATAAATLFAWLDREIWLLTAQANGQASGLIATSVSPASINPDCPRMQVALARQHLTWELVAASRAFALHLLTKDNMDLVWRFALQSGRDIDKFAGLGVTTAATGSPILTNTVGWLDCRVEASLDVGDRTIHVAAVVEGQVTHFAAPLTEQELLAQAPAPLLTQLQRRKHQDSHREYAALRAWREERQGK